MSRKTGKPTAYLTPAANSALGDRSFTEFSCRTLVRLCRAAEGLTITDADRRAFASRKQHRTMTNHPDYAEGLEQFSALTGRSLAVCVVVLDALEREEKS